MVYTKRIFHLNIPLWKRYIPFPNKLKLGTNLFSIITIFLISITTLSICSKWSYNEANIHESYAYNSAVTSNREYKRDETKISHILFGIGGSALTWNTRAPYTQLWWKPNVTRGFVWFDKRPSPENEPWPKTFPPYRVSQNTSAFKYTCSFGDRSVVRLVRIIKENFELGLENVRWFVMGDDDTVFFTENLVTVLAKYDHNQMYYIGGISYDAGIEVLFTYGVACGGGGFAISYPLAVELVKILDGCINRYHYLLASDQKIAACIAEIGVPLTKEVGFNQMDIQGSPRGILAAHPLAPLVSLHHLDHDLVEPLIPSMSPFDSAKKVMEAYKKDPCRMVQQSLCYDLKRNWSLLVSWGYSVHIYPWLMNAMELGTPMQTFGTWIGFLEPFTFNTRPYYGDPCKRPIEYYLNQVFEIPSNSETLTSYNQIVDSNKQCHNERYIPALAVHMVNVTALVLSPSIWRQAPQRQCCEVINDKDDNETVLHINIRGCNQWETVTPHFYDKYGDFVYIQRPV